MTVQRIPVKVEVRITVRGTWTKLFPLNEPDLRWEQPATLLIDIKVPNDRPRIKAQEESQ